MVIVAAEFIVIVAVPAAIALVVLVLMAAALLSAGASLISSFATALLQPALFTSFQRERQFPLVTTPLPPWRVTCSNTSG